MSSATHPSRFFSSLLGAALLVLTAGCPQPQTPAPVAPTAVATAPSLGQVGVPVLLDGTQSTAPAATPTLQFHWSFLRVPALSTAKLNDATLAQPSFIPDAVGTYAVQLVVDDGTLVSRPVSVTLTVSNECAPTISAFMASAAPAVGDTVSLTATTTSACASADPASATIVAWRWSLASVPAGSRAEFVHATTAAAWFVADVRGDYDVVLVTTDARGRSNDAADPKSHFKVTARPCGDNPPAVTSLAATPSTPDVLQPVALSAVVTDADVDTCGLTRTLGFRWQLTSVPAGSLAALNDGALKSPSFRPDIAGEYVASLIVTDDLGHKSTQKTLTITTSSCGAAIPVAFAQVTTPASGSVAVGQVVQLGTGVVDTDNPAADGGLNPDSFDGGASAGGACALPLNFTYEWSLLTAPAGSHVQLTSHAANPSFTPDVHGDYAFKVVVSTSTHQVSEPSYVTVHVVDCGTRAPVASVTAPSSWLTGRALGTPDVSATVTDPNSTGSCALTTAPYQYAWSLVQVPAGSLAHLTGATQPAPSFTPDVAGTYTLGLVVTDALGLSSAQATAQVTVGPCNQPIALSGMTFTTAGSVNVVNNPVALGVAATNPNPSSCYVGTSGTALQSEWTLVARPPRSAAQLTNPFAVSPKFTPDVAGVYALSVRVSDALGNASSLRGTTTTAPCNQGFAVTIAAGTGQGELGALVTLSAQISDPLNAAACGLPSVAPFTYAWQLAPPSNSTSAVLFNDRSAQPSFVPDVSGSYNYSVTVTDATGAQATVGSAAGTPTPPFVAHNCAITPSIVPGGPTTGLNVGASQALTGSFTVNADCAGLYTGSAGASPLPVRYEWSFDSVPAGSVAVLSNANGAGASFTVDRPGSSSTWVVRLTARDQLTGASASTTASFSASSCGTAPISAFAGVLNASLPCNGTLCTWTFTAPAAQFVAVPHPCPPNSQSTCVGAAVDLFMTVGTLPLPYFVELFAGDPTSTGVSTVRYSTGSPNAACGGVLTYAWTLYAAPPGSAAATTTSIGPSNAGQPTAKLDVKGLYVFQLVETEQFPGTSSLPPRQSTSYFQISVQ